MKSIVNLSLDELDSRITHFENRLTDTIIYYLRGPSTVYQRNVKRTKER